MTRPAVSVVMPFAGTAAEARAAAGTLLGLERREGDELIIADNTGTVPATPGVTVVSAPAERSPAHARNAGAERACADWILFLDADCHPRAGVLDAYFASPVDDEVGALAGGVAAAGDEQTLAARYGAARNFLSQEAHLAHPYRPRAVAANLMVRRAAFEQLGGFYEGLRAAEDTDFSWRLQEAGWRLEIRPEAGVEHRYRATVPDLRRQWRGYAAGRAWLSRRYPGFSPEPALVRALRRMRARGRGGAGVVGAPAPAPAAPVAGRDNRPAYLALDALLALDELAGFALSNRPARDPAPPATVVLIVERFPAPGLAEAPGLAAARVEAARRPDAIDSAAARGVTVDYREDDGIGARAAALTRLMVRHPVRCAVDVRARRPGEPSTLALAPAALRVARDGAARVQAFGGPEAQATARRLAALAGTRLEPGRP